MEELATSSSSQMLRLLDDSSTKVQRSLTATKDFLSFSAKITNDLTTVENEMSQSVNGIKEQQIGIEQITKAINEVSVSTKEASTQTSTVSQSADDLLATSASVNKLVQNFLN